MNRKCLRQLKVSLTLAALIFLNATMSAQIVVTADPALAAFDIRNLDNTQANANILEDGHSYLLDLSFLNNYANAIPALTAKISINLGSLLFLDPAFDLTTAGNTAYMVWQYDAATNVIYGYILNALPANFYGTSTFKVKTNGTGSSIVTGNFLVTNPPGNPYILSDNNSGNNTADISYTVAAGGPMPVTLTKFNADKKDCIITSFWSVENELNFNHYELQVSKDGATFSTVNSITAHNSRDYSSGFDISSLSATLQGSNTLFLRLKMVDNDGSYKYSNIVPISGNCVGKPAFVIYGYPNPVINSDNGLTIAAREGMFNGKYIVSVLDMSGRVYVTKEIELSNVKNFRFNFGTMLTKGKYMIMVQQKEGEQKGIIQIEKL